MKAWRLLMLPWMAWSRTARSVAAACLAVVIGAAVLVAAFTYRPGPAWIDTTAHDIAVVNALLWACVMSQSLLLAREAWLIYGYLLINASSAAALPLFGGHALAARSGVMVGLALLWATLLTPLAMLGWRGWRRLRRRPHPFLANA